MPNIVVSVPEPDVTVSVVAEQVTVTATTTEVTVTSGVSGPQGATGPGGGGGGAVDSVAGRTGDVVLTADDMTDGTVNYVFTVADDSKLAGIAAGATVNSSDATLLARANHTGTQLAATISDLSTAVDARIAAETSTGTGSNVRASSPTLVTPNLGTPSAATLTNATGLPVGGITASGTPSGTTYLRGDGSWSTPAGGSATWTEAEIDFGSNPVRSKRFTITDAGVTGASKIAVLASGKVATGRVGNDWEWDAITFAALPGTGTFTLTALASGRVLGKRTIQYQVS